MKHFLYILSFCCLLSCTTSNTIYKKPKNLIPKDSMIALLTDMYIASATYNIKDKFLKRDENYTFLVYQKYKIDTTRFTTSNVYYTSKTEEYSDMLKKVKFNIDSLERFYKQKNIIKDSLNKAFSTLNKKDSLK
ncbi:DUF4296 domain-containing protein [Tenacibaculum aestuariivivum]|uniref:DUF4296 domain-containing protein n=1 Tax=Tenacibaculum aestuariivivum TaxID=2006131 RepID=UPI003AB60980